MFCVIARNIFSIIITILHREPSTESDYLKQALFATLTQRANVASNSLPKKEKSTFQAPASPGQIRLAKESAAVESLTMSRMYEKVGSFQVLIQNK